MIVILAIVLAVLLAACLILAQAYFIEEEEPVPSEEPAGSQAPSPTPGPTPEPTPEPSPEETPEPGGRVPESDAVADSYFDDAAFFGDSLTLGIGTYGVMSNADVIAFTGANPVSALESAQVTLPGGERAMTMIEALREAAPAKIYILLGANWLGRDSGIDEETFMKRYGALLERIQEEHPDAAVYVQSIFPVSRRYETNENGKNTYGLSNDLIRTYNEALEELAGAHRVWYLDLYSELCDEEGYLPDDKSSDGMHLVPEYYQKWFDYLKTHTAPEPEGAAE